MGLANDRGHHRHYPMAERVTMNYFELSMTEGDWEFVLDILEANFEAVERSTDEDAPMLRKHLMRVIGTLNVQMLMAQGELGDISTH